MARPTNAKLAQELLSEAKTFYERNSSMESTNRALALEDIRFVDEEGAQWDKKTLQARGTRPAYTFDRTSIAIEQVKGDQRQTTPQIKILPVDNTGDRKVAQIYEGLIRAIERNSAAKSAYDTAFDFALKGGFGVWRIYPKYVQDSFDQELCIERVENPFTVTFDESAKDVLKRDGNGCIISERISVEAFEAQYPDEEIKSLDMAKYERDWLTSDEVRVAEYYKRVRTQKTLALLSDGRVVDYDEIRAIEDELANPLPETGLQPVKVVRKRKSDTTIIRWWKIYGGGILEGPTDYNWKYIPVVPVYGRITNIEGRRKYRGLVRKAKDPQKAYNSAQTAAMEAVFSVPKAPYLLTSAQIKGYEAQWRSASVTNPLVLYFNADKTLPNGGKPNREPMPEIPTALLALAASAADGIKAATGKFSSSLGEEDNASLPGAIRQRNTEGDISSYEFMDNLAESKRFTGEILVNMIPTVYDGARIVRILGIDGKEDFVPINQRDRDGTLVNDLSQGRFDVAVDLGPAYTTQRQQAADYLMKFASVSPSILTIASDLMAKFMDFDGADELERRLRIPLIQQGIIPPDQLTEEEQAMLPQGPPPPDPTQVALLRKLDADAQRSQALAQKAQVDAQSAIVDAQLKPAELQKLIAETVSIQLSNLLSMGEIGIDPRSGRPALMKYMQEQGGNALARRSPVTVDMQR